jgi:hypothetical protein
MINPPRFAVERPVSADENPDPFKTLTAADMERVMPGGVMRTLIPALHIWDVLSGNHRATMPCPHCSGLTRLGAKVCPHCAEPLRR